MLPNLTDEPRTGSQVMAISATSHINVFDSALCRFRLFDHEIEMAHMADLLLSAVADVVHDAMSADAVCLAHLVLLDFIAPPTRSRRSLRSNLRCPCAVSRCSTACSCSGRTPFCAWRRRRRTR